MNVREFLTKWGFEVEHDKLDKFEGQLEAIKHRLEFLTGVELVKGLYELSEKFAHVGEEIHIAALNTGLTVEQFQRFQAAAERMGVSGDEVQTGMARLARTIYAARNGSAEAAQAFGLLGISGEQIHGFKNAGDAMLALSDRFNAIHDPIKKAALAQQLMGRGSYQMIGFLSQGSKALREQGEIAQRLGLVLSKEQVENLVEFERAAKRLFLVLTGIAKTIAAEVAPGFTYLANDAIKFVDSLRGLIGLNFKNWLYSIGYVLGVLWESVKIGIKLLIELAKRFHLEGEILPTIGKIAGLVTALYALNRMAAFAKGALGLLAWGFNLVLAPVRALAWAWGILNAEMLAWAAAVAVVVVSAHDLYALFTGQTTWVEKLYEMAKPLGIIRDILAEIGKTLIGPMAQLAPLIRLASNWWSGRDLSAGQLGAPGLPLSSAATSAAGVTPPGFVGPPAPSSRYEVNAPLTITVPPGTSPDGVHKSVKDGIREHLDRLFREAQASTLSPQVY